MKISENSDQILSFDIQVKDIRGGSVTNKHQFTLTPLN